MMMRTATARNIQLLFEEEETVELGEELEEGAASDVAEAPALVVPLTVTFRVMCVQVTVVCFSSIFPSKSAVFASQPLGKVTLTSLKDIPSKVLSIKTADMEVKVNSAPSIFSRSLTASSLMT